MIERLIKFLSVLSSIFTVLFFVLLYAMHQGYDPGPLLRGEFDQAYSVNPSREATSTPKAEPAPSPKESSPTTTPTQSKSVATTTSVARVVKTPAPVVKKPVKTDPKVLAPTPLIVEKKSPPPAPNPTPTAPAPSSEPGTPSIVGALNQKQILDIVNLERAKAGLPALGFNIRLSAMAEGKAVDMINKQYFAHVSPTGVDVSQLSKTYGYAYIYLGENLAMGDFVSSSDVMTGWMNSPGHRANILNKNYTEVGIAALEGNYQGRVVWYAVQEFGRPLSSCPSPDASLEAKIAKEEQQVSETERTLSSLHATIEQSAGDQSTYNALVEQYNALVDQYNVLVAMTKADIATFNTSVTVFNDCIGSNSTSTPAITE